MIDDTRQPSFQQYDAAFASQLAAISKCRITRRSCYDWAQNLKYLAYDDSYDLQSAPCPQVETVKNENEREEEKGRERSSLSLADEDACKLCRSCPKFPTHKKATAFQLVQFGKRGEKNSHRPCDHYLAVSYCWPKDAQGVPLQFKSTYSVTTTDSGGTRVTRPVRAPDEIIDRAVDCAKALNIRLIWLDQECLPQDESEEHATGVQAMDMVYQQAYVSVGLIDQVSMTQAQLSAIAVVLGAQVNPAVLSERQLLARPVPFDPDQVVKHLLKFLDAFAEDPFNSRAWILQEMISAGNRAVLLFKYENGSHYQESHRVISLPQFKIPGTFNILLGDVLCLISNAREFLLSFQNPSFGRPLSARAERVMAKLRLFHPQPSKANHWSSFVHVRGGTAYGPRKTCNAAVALTYLSKRYNYNVADRLAILANICDYEIRLDILKIEKQCQSLATCIFALAFINGDLSLFLPETYSCSPILDHMCIASGYKSGHEGCLCTNSAVGRPSWMISFHQLVPFIYTNVLKAGQLLSLRNGNMYEVQDSRIVLPGYLWRVSRQIDLRPIQERFKSTWDDLERCQGKLHHKLGETGSDFELSRQMLQEYMGPNQQFQDDARARVPEEAMARAVSAHHIDRDPDAQVTVALLMYHILAYLHRDLGETGAANSIWHSIRSDSAGSGSPIPGRETPEPIELPDEVEEVLSECEDLPDLWEAFKFDHSLDGSFLQFWIVERIMRKGCLWVGQYEKFEFPEASASDCSDKQKQIEMKSLENAKSKILGKQLVQQALASAILSQTGENMKISVDAGINIGALVGYASEISWREWTSEGEERRGKRVSVFDVDGPCEIFVPFDHDLEVLPRANHRSMSLCWVVQRVDDHKDKHLERGQSDPSYTTVSGVQEQSDEQSLGPLAREIRHVDDTGASEPRDQESEEERKPCATLRIVDRVKGAWECMYPPAQRYAII